MIERKTTLVLGAGASHEAGFPLGEQLIREIHSLAIGKTKGFKKRDKGEFAEKEVSVSNKELLCRLLEIAEIKKEDDAYYSITDLENFAEDLWNAHLPSIDDFLFKRKKYALIGKLCIFFVLSGYEESNRFKPNKIDRQLTYPELGWYKYLWHQLQEGTDGKFENLLKNDLSVITFNYDRSLEHFLYKTIEATYGLHNNTQAIAGFFQKVPIMHVYGELGVLPWKLACLQDYKERGDALNDYLPQTLKVLLPLFGDVGQYRGSSSDFLRNDKLDEQTLRKSTAKKIVLMANQIKTYQEIDYGQEYEQILGASTRIYFLGCAYHEQNVMALWPSGSRKMLGGEIFGTCIGMTDREALEVKRRIIKTCRQNSPHNFNFDNIACKWDGSEKAPSLIASFLRSIAPFQ